jgi:predicted amidohydrolase YtcJ
MDLIIEGNIHILSDAVPHVEAVGVEHGKIVAAGSTLGNSKKLLNNMMIRV